MTRKEGVLWCFAILVIVFIISALSVELEFSADDHVQQTYAVLGASIRNSTVESGTGDRSDNGIDAVSDCQRAFLALSIAIENYTHCVMTNSLFSTVCSSCIAPYNMAETMQQAAFSSFTDEFGQPCSDRMIVSAGGQMEDDTNKFLTNSWVDLHCKDCYANQSTGELLADYTLFFNKFNQLIGCINNVSTETHFDIHLFAPFNASQNTTVCLDCGEYYKQLDDVYAKFDKNSTNKVCQDIGDVMNYTRYVWRDGFECKHRPGRNAVLWFVSAFLCILPVTFYCSSFLNGSDVSKKPVQQKRLRSYLSVLNNLNSST